MSATAVVPGLPVLDRCRVFAIINVTPDSFSDGGLHDDTATAVRHGLDMLNAGADVLDVGGESTRPGALRVSERAEIARVVPVVEQLAAAGAIVSVDTMRATVARAALDAGARIINDVSGGLADPERLRDEHVARLVRKHCGVHRADQDESGEQEWE